MSTSLRLELVALASLALSAFGSFHPAIAAATFDQKEVDQGKFIAVASPYGNQAHQLLILEQVSSTRPCWQENNAQVDPLLLKFDFTGICGRSTDSNGYSIRLAGQDLGVKYNLRVVNRNGQLVLLGVPNRGQQAPTLEIGTAQVDSGFAKITLNPGWRLTKRVYNGKTLGHVYLTHDTALDQFPVTNVATASPISTPTKPAPAPVVSTPRPNVTGTVTTPSRLPQVTVRPTQPQGVSPSATPSTAIPILVPPPETNSQPISVTRPTSATRPAASSLPLPTLNPAVVVPPARINQPASRQLPPPPVVSAPVPTLGTAGTVVPTTSVASPVTKPQSGSRGFVVPTIEEGSQSSVNNSTNSAEVPLNLPTVTVYR